MRALGSEREDQEQGGAGRGFGIALAAAVVALVAVASFLLSHRWDKREDGLVPPVSAPEAPPAGEGAPKREVQLFFATPDEESLAAESREILLSDDLAEQARTTIEELIRGPLSANLLATMPPGTALREVFLDLAEGYAYVDLNQDVMRNHPGGSQAEALTVFSLVNTLTHNFHQVRRVQILIEGREAETLAGHILIQRPLSADPSWLKRG